MIHCPHVVATVLVEKVLSNYVYVFVLHLYVFFSLLGVDVSCRFHFAESNIFRWSIFVRNFKYKSSNNIHPQKSKVTESE